MTDELGQDAVDRALDGALGRLHSIDLEPLAARAQLRAAQRRLAQGGRRLSVLERCEPALLVAFSAAHLVWAIIHVLHGG